MEMKAYRVRPSLLDFEHVLGRPGEGPRRVVDLGRAQGRAVVVQRDRPGRGQDPGAGAGRVAEERAVVDGGVHGGAAVDEVIVGGGEGKGENERGESAQAEQQEGARIELRERLHLRGAAVRERTDEDEEEEGRRSRADRVKGASHPPSQRASRWILRAIQLERIDEGEVRH